MYVKKIFFLFLLLAFSSCRQGGHALKESLYEKDILSQNEIQTQNIHDQTITAHQLKNQSIDHSKIKNKSITAKKLGAMGAQKGELLFWNGTSWTPTAQGPWVLENGKLGIGTSQPIATLHVRGPFSIENASQNAQIYVGENSSFSIRASDDLLTYDPLFYIDSSTGNVGIGTETPKVKLEIKKDFMIYDGNHASVLHFPQTGTFQIQADDDPSNPSDAVSLMSVEGNTHHIGMLTQNPSEDLEVKGDMNLSGSLRLGNSILGKKIYICEYKDTAKTFDYASFNLRKFFCWNKNDTNNPDPINNRLSTCSGNNCCHLTNGTVENPSGSCIGFLSKFGSCRIDEDRGVIVPGDNYFLQTCQASGGFQWWAIKEGNDQCTNNNPDANHILDIKVIYFCI